MEGGVVSFSQNKLTRRSVVLKAIAIEILAKKGQRTLLARPKLRKVEENG